MYTQTCTLSGVGIFSCTDCWAISTVHGLKATCPLSTKADTIHRKQRASFMMS